MRTLAALALCCLCLVNGQAQEDEDPRVAFLAPADGTVVHDRLLIEAEGINFRDLKTFGFAVFSYAPEGGDFKEIGRDRNTFDGLSLLWDTSGVADGAYTLRVEVTDLFNLTGTGEVSVFVNNEGNQSLTRRVVRNLVTAFEALARALDFPPDLTLTESVDLLFENLESASAAFETTLEDVNALRASSPEAVAQADPFLRHASLFEELAEAINAARAGFRTLEPGPTEAALEAISAAARRLAPLRPNGVDLAPLAEVAEIIDASLADLDLVFETVGGGASGESVEETLRAFLQRAQRAAAPVERVAQRLEAANADCPVTFSDGQGRTAVHYAVGATAIRIGLPGAAGGEIDWYDAAGDPLGAGVIADGTFLWEAGADQPAGRYFFVAAFGRDGQAVTKTGRVVLRP